MKKYTFITILLLFLILSVFMLGAMITPNEKPPFWVIYFLIGTILNFGVWLSIIIAKLLEY